MPSILTREGFPRTARPAIYAKVDASALAGGNISSGNIAVVGDFPTFETGSLNRFYSRRSAVAYDPADLNLAMIAQCAFSPSDDALANNGASSLLMVNMRETCTASTIAIGPLTLTSKITGLRANRLRAGLAISGADHTLSIERNGISEAFTASSNAVATVTNARANAITLTWIDGTLKIVEGVTTLLEVSSSEAPTLASALAFVDTVEDLSTVLLDPSITDTSMIDYESGLVVANGATGNIEATAYRLQTALASSQLVTSALENDATASALSVTAIANATGGAQGNSLDAPSALATIENEDVQIVVFFDTDGSRQAGLSAHLTASANAGFERQAYTAFPSTSSLADLKTRAVALNSAGIALVGQSARVYGPTSALTSIDSRYVALMLAGMQAGSSIGEPLTRKRPRVVDFSQVWDAYADIEEVLRGGILALTTDHLGARVERGLTTYLTDGNPIYSEISAYESCLSSLRDLRSALNDQIGRPTKQSQLGVISSRVSTRLVAQQASGMIKAFRGVTLEDLGDEIAISYEIAPVEPLNFITLTAVAVRISGV